MKDTYIQPEMYAVRLQQMQMLCQSLVDGIDSNVGINLGGSSEDDTSGQGARVKENIAVR